MPIFFWGTWESLLEALLVLACRRARQLPAGTPRLLKKKASMCAYESLEHETKSYHCKMIQKFANLIKPLREHLEKIPLIHKTYTCLDTFVLIFTCNYIQCKVSFFECQIHAYFFGKSNIFIHWMDRT